MIGSTISILLHWFTADTGAFEIGRAIGALIIPFGIFLAGTAAISLGAKGFDRTGLPLTNEKNITGEAAKGIGVVCVAVGLVFMLMSIVMLAFMSPLLAFFAAVVAVAFFVSIGRGYHPIRRRWHDGLGASS